MRTPNPFVVCSCIYAYCLEIAISPKWCTHLVLIAVKMHICMSSQQKDLVYALGQDVPKLVYAFWTCKPVICRNNLNLPIWSSKLLKSKHGAVGSPDIAIMVRYALELVTFCTNTLISKGL